MNATDIAATRCRYSSKSAVWLVVLAYVSTPVCAVGFAMNALSFVVLRRHRSRSNALHLLRLLAVVDNCFLAVSVSLVNARRFYAYFKHASEFFYLPDAFVGPRFIVYLAPPHLILRMFRNWLIVLISVDRAMHVVAPLKSIVLCSRNRVNTAVVAIAALSVAMHVFRYCCRPLTMEKPDCSIDDGIPLPMLRFRNDIPRVVDVVTLSAFVIVIPFCLLGATNTILSVRLFAARAKRRTMTSVADGAKKTGGADQELQATLLAFGIVVTFLVCESPNSVERIVEAVFYGGKKLRTHPMIQVLIQLDSCVNFIVYSMTSRKFRVVTGQVVTCSKTPQ
ncbi:FMRFamide receptor-like [Tubulanus polymorphus]|uniref:FMRFamide receptor-like n=1 Tax=Tubulanus polymorphus TaxID=672921 RepID=UPI003DA32FAA